MSVECEQQLVERAPGDPEAFRQLYNIYLPRVYAYVGYRVGAEQDTEDLVADIFLKVVEELGRFEWRHSKSFAAWVFRIAHNLVANFHRDTGRAGTLLPLDALPDIAANALLPEDSLLRKELFARLRDAVNALPARRREVVSLRYFAGLHNHEIAQVLGIDERTVGSTLSRALDELQALLSTSDTLGSKDPPGR
ncbi:MAG TPA: sigma-70 family RNA polymerase sigma factor [Chloroflexia bacterium]|nr:sigma-70 family RNA polymerase sigma factor [Chloroflexia bacterium]